MSLLTREAGDPRQRVRWREAGVGAPVVLLPGLGLSGRFYVRNATAIAAAGFRLIIPDMPALGGTRGPRTGYGVEPSALFALAFIDLLELERVHWIGHSIGAQHGIAAVVRAPDRALSLCLTGPTGGHAHYARRIAHQVAGIAREALHAGPRVIGAVLREYVRVSPVAYVGTWLRGARDEPFAHAPRVTCPTLFVVGTEDPVADHAFVERLAGTMPNAQIAWIDGGGHALPRGAAAGFNAAIITFLSALRDTP